MTITQILPPRFFKKLFYSLLLGLGLFVVFGYKVKPKENIKHEFKPTEVVIDVIPDRVFNTKYVVRLKRIEIVENEYWLHTNKKYVVGDTYKSVF